MRRGIYRLVEFPPGEREDLVILWLWSEQRGVFSHGTALSLHGLSDLLPERIHMTLPEAQRGMRRAVPRGLALYFADIPKHDRAWYGSVPLTSPKRTLLDCTANSYSPEVLEQALEQAVARGLLDVEGVTRIARGIEVLERK